MKKKIIPVVILVVLAVGIFALLYYFVWNEVGETQLIIDKSYDIKGLNSLTYDDDSLWGLAGYPSYSGVEYKKRIIQIDKSNGSIKAECSIDFTGMGISFIENSLWVITKNNKIFKINPQICIKKEECNQENNCIYDSINLTLNEIRGFTYDGKYLYIINRDPGSNSKISKYSLDGEFIENVITDLDDIRDIVWDGEYFWTIESVFMVSVPEVTPPPSHYDIRAYNKSLEEVFYQKFEIKTPVWYGITYDGENLWISDGYHDKVHKIKIIGRKIPQENCAKEGEQFSEVYEEYPKNCCGKLTEWMSGLDTRISIGDGCYETGLTKGSPYGTCINCGNGICEDIEDVCNCPQDCSNGENSDYETIEEFCQEKWSQFEDICEGEYMKDFPICNLC